MSSANKCTKKHHPSYCESFRQRTEFAKVMAERNDNECPEVWDGESVIVEINPE